MPEGTSSSCAAEGGALRLREQGSDRMIRLRRVAAPTIVVLATGFLAVSSSQATTTRAAADCRTVVAGAPWKIALGKSGSNYTLVARGMSCASARPWAIKFTHQAGTGIGQVLKGPSGFRCHSFST